MQTLILSGNLAADCEIVPGKERNEFIRFTVAAKEPGADKDEKPTYYTCRMRKTGVAERLKKGRYVSLVRTSPTPIWTYGYRTLMHRRSPRASESSVTSLWNYGSEDLCTGPERVLGAQVQ